MKDMTGTFWEYRVKKVHELSFDNEVIFNRLGEQGFHLVAVEGGFAYFERAAVIKEG